MVRAVCIIALGVALLGCSRDVDRVANLTSTEVFDDADARELARAAAGGDVDEIKRLTGKGVDVNHAGKHGITPLWWAIAAGNYSGFSFLLANGADPNVRVEKSHMNIMQWAAMRDDSRFLEAALQNGGEPNLVTHGSGETPLMSAILSDNTRNFMMLIEAGADLNQLNAMGGTAAHTAASVRDYAKLEVLVERGTDLSIRDNLGRSVRDILAKVGERHPEARKVLRRLPETKETAPGS